MSRQRPYRSIAPGPAPPGSSRPATSSTRSTKVSTACKACKVSRRKCSGSRPCDACRERNQECVFDETLDQRRHVAAKRNVAELEFYRDILNDLFQLLRAANQVQILELVEFIRADATLEEVRAHIDTASAAILTESQEQGRGARRVSGSSSVDEAKSTARRVSKFHRPGHYFRNKVMDVGFLSYSPPITVPASPWTTVTADDDIVSHLVSLYFTWDNTFHLFIDRSVFVKHMAAANLNTEFCSPFLVNALLANACHQSEFAEAYATPGDELTKGAHFLEEAERLWEVGRRESSLTNLQASLLIHERYSLFGDDDLGYIWLNRGIEMGLRLGLINDNGGVSLDTADQSSDMETSRRQAAWGLFQIDTISHGEFLKPSRITRIQLPRPEVGRVTSPIEGDEQRLWQPYPMIRDPRPAYNSQFFEESCNLTEIEADITRNLYPNDVHTPEPSAVRSMKEEYSRRLQTWHGKLPSYFDPNANTTPAPHILLLHIRYFTIIINVFTAHADQRGLPSEWPTEDRDRTLSSARSIAELIRVHRSEFGISRCHFFVLYAVNLAAFVFLQSFDGASGLDPTDADFSSLANAFFILANRSILGRTLLHSFEQNLRASFGKQDISKMHLSRELRAMLTTTTCATCSADLTHLSEMEEDDRYPIFRGPEDQAGIGVKEMLKQYEALSLGKNDEQTKSKAAEPLER